jgi:uncharacterized membrane protein
MATLRTLLTVAATLAVLLAATAVLAVPPDYLIVDMGLVDPGDDGAQANGVSPLGTAAGRCLGVSNQGFAWSEAGGLLPLPDLAGFPFGVANDANDLGAVVGTCAATPWGADPRPVIWEEGVLAQLALPPGESLGRGEDVNNLGFAVGSVNGGSLQRAAVYGPTGSFVVTTTTDLGAYGTTFFGVNDANLAVGVGIDPGDAARNVGFVYDITGDTATEVGALPGRNGAICFGVSNAGHVVGSTMLFQGSGVPFVWTAGGGMQEVPLPAGTSQGMARAVNSDGWVVGTASSAFAVPFLYDGEATYRLDDLLPADSGWDLAENTFSSAEGISEEGMIVGSGVYQGNIRAYAMIPDDVVPVLLQEFAAEGREDGIALRWQLWLDGAAAAVVLERATAAGGPWQPVAAPVVHDGRIASVLDGATEAGRTYHYRLALHQADRTHVLGLASAARATVGALGVALGAPAPNPTRGETALAYRLPVGQHVRITVHDVRGRLVRGLVDATRASGEYAARWDGRRDDGRLAPAGVYFVTLQAAQASRTQRVVLTR